MVAGYQPRGQALLLIYLTTCAQIINLNIRQWYVKEKCEATA